MGIYRTYSIPEGLDIKKLLKKYPPLMPNFRVEDALFIVEYVAQHSTRDYIRLNIHALHKYARCNVIDYIAWLITSGIIESKIEDTKRSTLIWQRFTKQYRKPLVEYQLAS